MPSYIRVSMISPDMIPDRSIPATKLATETLTAREIRREETSNILEKLLYPTIDIAVVSGTVFDPRIMDTFLNRLDNALSGATTNPSSPYIFDKNASTYNEYSVTGTIETEVLRIDAGQAKTFKSIYLKLGLWGSNPNYATNHYLYFSSDGLNWTQVYSYSKVQTSEERVYLRFYDVTLRYIRLTSKAPTSTATAYSRVYEVVGID